MIAAVKPVICSMFDREFGGSERAQSRRGEINTLTSGVYFQGCNDKASRGTFIELFTCTRLDATRLVVGFKNESRLRTPQ